MNRRLLIISLILIFVVGMGFWLFDQMGGNNPIEISLVEKRPEPLSGIYFVGVPGDERLAKAFETIEAQKSLHPGTALHTIYEIEPAGKLDTMRVFIGINALISADLMEYRQFESSRFLLAKVNGSKWVMPGPNTVKEKIISFADSANLKLSEIYIDKIISEREVHVIALIKD
ncbi:hypothetical protein [Algoriphagus hitonicola]|uniref:GyrI-like small molecule binding domain-containing protein n=1 Tax=Algoriphagus hitonicola TaxID=435880 RepID=A0A1I2VBH5_9BACT|nr:hypothetical protein [Algoriphagus hitonicola]SFG86572.1 hypothetical protein SAMN04487988_109114 [Algoriphagus hitonicola]